MPAVLVPNISPETHRALQVRARKHGRSTEAESRAILDHAARPAARMRLGSALAALAKPFGGATLLGQPGIDSDLQRIYTCGDGRALRSPRPNV
jgi:antitoxin FitA